MMLNTFVLAGHITFFINNIISKMFDSKKFDNLKINTFYNSILIFSKIQHLLLKFNKQTNNKIPKLINYISNITKNKDENVCKNAVELYKNGKLILKTNESNFFKNMGNDYDLAIFNVYINKCNKCLNDECIDKHNFSLNDNICNSCNNEGLLLKKIYNSSSSQLIDITNYDNKINFKQVNYKFVLFEIIIGELSIQLDLHSKNNYLLYGNILDKNFIKYFLYKYHKKDVEKLNETNLNNYKIRIIDENVNINEYDSNTRILIDEDKYIILDT